MALTNRVWSKRALSIPAAMLLAAALAVPASLLVGSAASATVEDPATPGASVELKADDSTKNPADESVEDTAEAADAADPISGGGGALSADPDEETEPAEKPSDAPEEAGSDNAEDSVTKPKEGVAKENLGPLLNRGPLFEALEADAVTVVEPLEGAMATGPSLTSRLPGESVRNLRLFGTNQQEVYVRSGETAVFNLELTAGATIEWVVAHPSGERARYRMTAPGSFKANNTIYSAQTVTISPQFLTGENEGILTVEFTTLDVGNDPSWANSAIWYRTNLFVHPQSRPSTVGSLSVEEALTLFDQRVRGRAFSKEIRVVQQLVEGPRDIKFWSLLYSGQLYEVSAFGYMGVNSVINTTTSGPRMPNVGGRCVAAYKSLHGVGTVNAPCGTKYNQFFETPAAGMPAFATREGERVPLAPDLISNEQMEAVPLTWKGQGTAGTPYSGSLEWMVPELFTGTYELQIDADGDGTYEGARDRSIPFNAGFGQGATGFEFDGRDADGVAIGAHVEVSARLYFENIGEVHFSLYDVEWLGGLTIVRQNGVSPGSTIYWDDTSLATDIPDVTVPSVLDGTTGFPSDIPGGVHGWVKGPRQDDTWGNDRWIDNWAYEPLQAAAKVKPFALTPDVQVQKQSAYDQVTGKVTYTVNVRNEGLGYFDDDFVAGIAMLARDQTKGVLDDAVFNNDLAVTSANSAVKATFDSATGYVRVFLDNGASFGPGDTATVTYSMTVSPNQTGDATLLNYAEAANYDPDDPKFGCTDENGVPLLMVGSSSGWSKCSWTTDLVPVLSIEKSADKTELYGLNDVATYKVKVTNHGPGVLNSFNFGGTNGVNPVMVDDLSKVIDDAQLVWTDTGGTVPENTFYEDGGKLYWHGTLAVGETRTLSYQAKVVKDLVEDYELNNTACLADNIVLAKDADRCSKVDITRAGLAMSKTVDPEPETLVKFGDTLTYTLTFHNPGKAAAKVDTIDILDGLLDDAVVNDDWVVKDGTITVTPDITGQTGKLILKGTVPAGNTATITYTATVMSEEEHEGDRDVVNMLLASPEVTPDCTDPGAFCVWNPLAVTPHLPFTGTDGLMRLLVLGGGVVVVLLVVARRLTKRAG